MKSLIKKLTTCSLLLLFFSRFILTTIPAQAALLLLFLRKPVLPTKVYIYLLVVIFYWVTVFLTGYSNIQAQHLLFYFSFIPPLLAMFSMKLNTTTSLFIIDKFIIAICMVTILEAFLVNSPLLDYLYFFPPEGSSERVNFLGFYQRPLGIAGNASMTSIVLIFSIVLADAKNQIFSSGISEPGIQGETKIQIFLDRQTIFLTIAILVLASGTGFILLLLYLFTKLLAKFKLNEKYLVLFISTLAFLALLIFSSILVSEPGVGFDKFSVVYLDFIIKHKIDNVIDVFENQNINIISVLFGQQVNTSMSHASTSSDFGFLTMYSAIGALGSALVLSTPILFMSSLHKFFIPTIFFYLSFIHYPGLLSPPGAVLFSLYIYILNNHSRLRNGQCITYSITQPSTRYKT